MEQLQIKVNGLCRVGDILRAAQIGVNYVGMQFSTAMPHHVTMLRRRAGTLPDMADADYSSLATEGGTSKPSLVGMFSGEGAQQVITAAYNYGLDAIQMDDDCSATFLRNLVSTIVPDIRPHLDIIKFFHIASSADFATCKAYEALASRFVFSFDADSVRNLSWADKARIADDYHGAVPFLVTCSATDVRDVAMAFRRNAAFCGVDVILDEETFDADRYLQEVQKMVGFVKD